MGVWDRLEPLWLYHHITFLVYDKIKIEENTITGIINLFDF